MQPKKKLLWITVSGVTALVCVYLFYTWYKSHNAIFYAVASSSVIAISGNDYETTLNKLHNISLVNELENDVSFELLQSNDFLKRELAHAPDFKKLFKNKRHLLSFKPGSGNQLQSLLAIEGNRPMFDSLINVIMGIDYEITKYSSPGGEIFEAYNTQKRKELVLSYAGGIIIITCEALYAEETLISISDHHSLFKNVTLNFTSNYIYIKQAAMQKWVDNITKNNTSEFYKWFENIDEIEFKLNEEGSLAKANLYFYENNKTQNIRKESIPFHLEHWVQNITSNYIAFHPNGGKAEIQLSEVYRCYTNLQDENISNNTFIIAQSELDSTALGDIFSKHSITRTLVINNHNVYKFGKYPFFKNFCNSSTPDLPESYITLVSKNVFVVTSSVASMIPIIQKISSYTLEIKNSSPGVFVMQVQPQNLLPYFSNIIKDDYRDNILESTFLQNLDFVQYRVDTVIDNKAVGTIFFNKNSSLDNTSAELLWSKTLEQEVDKITVIKSKREGENFILYQDEKNILHCFDFNTRELWQKFILGKIQSKIYNTDLYRNGQNQFFFNTTNQIYALNSRGGDLDNFPKQIYNEGIQGMYFFDMGDKYEYFFIQDNLIFGFDAGGASLEDWRPRESPVSIQRELLKFKKRNKNYLIGINRSGEILIWNRFGKLVERDIDFAMPLVNDFFITPAVNKKYRPELISVDINGNIYSITLDSLQKKEYRYKLVADSANNSKHFITRNNDSSFQKIIYQKKRKILLFDRYSQKTDTLNLPKEYNLQQVFDINEKHSFIVISNGKTNQIISSLKKVVANNIEGEVIEILSNDIPNQYYVVTLDQLKRVNLYKFSL